MDRRAKLILASVAGAALLATGLYFLSASPDPALSPGENARLTPGASTALPEASWASRSEKRPATIAPSGARAAAPAQAIASEPPPAITEAATLEACTNECGAPCERIGGAAPSCPAVCTADSECGVGARCMLPANAGETGETTRRCVHSECGPAGGSCGSDSQCTYHPAVGGGIYRCDPTGTLRAGAQCEGSAFGPSESMCGAGLKCWNGICVPAVCTQDSDCQKGFRCMGLAGGSEKGCAAYCDADTECPDGQLCFPMGNGTGQCAPRTAGATCLRDGCPEGLECMLTEAVTWRLAARCVHACDQTGPSNCVRGEKCIPAPWAVMQPLKAYCGPTASR